MNWYLGLVILGLCTERVTYFLLVDSLLEEPRKNVIRRITRGGDPDHPAWPMILEALPYGRRKVAEWMTCPYCMSVWVAAFATLLSWGHLDVPQRDVLMWLITWIAVATIALVWWKVIEGNE